MILPIFSGRRIQMLEAFSRAAADGNFETISKTWSEFWNNLRDARGIFSVADPKYDNLALPHDTDFGTRGYLRGLLDGKRLAMIQNAGSTRRFLYNKTIFCDTNFVSYCDARCRGKSLGNNEQSFNQAVLALLPMRDSVNAFCYMMENFENLRQDRVRGTLKSFAAFKLGNEDVFRRTGVIQSRAPESELERIADVCLNVMATQDFKILHGRMKEHYFGSLLVLTKALLIVLTTPKEWNSIPKWVACCNLNCTLLGGFSSAELKNLFFTN